jgi:uncharacterized protein YtpQ (UPF0354 family)
MRAEVHSVEGDKSDLVTGPLVGDFSWILVADMPQATRVINSEDLAKLGLTRDQALDLGRRNVLADLRPLSAVVQALPADGIGTIQGSFYESSRLCLHETWKELAAKMTGPLLVGAPGPDIVLYADGGRPHSLDALTTLVRYTAEHSQKPLSTQVFKWTEGGWIPAQP